MSILERFSEPTRAWFASSFRAPTPAQEGAWTAIASGQHTLVVAPTGSGKTLSAFLWSLDRLASAPAPEDALRRCRVLYISPLKALAVDVERNLRSPLIGIGHAAERLGLPRPDITTATRSGDTPAAERRAFAKHPADILITTPESLFLLLTSAAREALAGVETVIIDEIHAVAGTKRGAHLAVTLERLDALLPRPAQRIGLSATVRPVEEVARFLAGGRPVEIVAPPSEKQWDLDVVVPVPDMEQLPTAASVPGPGGDEASASLWPHVEERIVDLIAAHSSTLVFANSRRLAERLTARLNEIWAERLDPGAAAAPIGTRPPAQLMGSGESRGAPAVLARAHHGSVSKEQRAEIEAELKSGRLPAVVATSSLELGIDMGAVDLVIQVESPPSVASGLQRVGRAGHQVGATSHGVLFPKYRGDLVSTAVVAERMRSGAIEALHVPANPLDVLAQQIVAICALDEWTVADLGALVRRSAPFTGLPDSVLTATVDMLAGRYPSDAFAELRPRIVWDRVRDVVSGRPGAQRLAVVSGGTIPDRGMYGVFLAGAEGPGRRVGELDEEMVYESRVGDVFALGSSSWRIEEITHDRVLVTPAPGQPARLPFWKGDALGRPAELGAALGAFIRDVGYAPPSAARERTRAAGLDEWASDNLLAYLAEQRQAIDQLPSDRTLVLERFRDEIGDWRVVLHSPYGDQVHAPWGLVIAERVRERFGIDASVITNDDGLILRLPDLDGNDQPAWAAELVDVISIEPDEIAALVTQALAGSAVFAARFRECASRALLLPRRNPGTRQPLWQQRQRATQLLEIAAQFPDFPIVLEAVRECLQDVFDVDSLRELLRGLQGRRVRIVEAHTKQASPFARSMNLGYVASFLYEGDSPLAERRAAALTVDPSLLSALLGSDTATLRDLLDPDALDSVGAELQFLTPERAARDAEGVADLLRVLGPLSRDEIAARSIAGADVDGWLEALHEARRAVELTIAGRSVWAAVEDVARLRDALGVAVPVGLPQVLLEPTTDPLGSLLHRYARTHLPFTAAQVAERLGLGVGIVQPALQTLVARGQVLRGDYWPEQRAPGGQEFCDPDVLRRLRRRSLAALRAEVEAVDPRSLARFVPRWQSVIRRGRGIDGVANAVEQLAGYRIPASALETLVLPARVDDYRPALLDELVATGEVVWQGHGALGGGDGWISLHISDAAPLTLHPPTEIPAPAQPLLEALAAGGARFVSDVAARLERSVDRTFTDEWWELVWAGAITCDTLAPLRARLSGSKTRHRQSASPRRARGRMGALGALRPSRPQVAAPDELGGRWSVLGELDLDATRRAWGAAELLLDRYGVVTRGVADTEEIRGGFSAVYRVLAAAEEAGKVRRGYFVEGLGAAQFATPGAVDQLRSLPPLREPDPSPLAAVRGEQYAPEVAVLAATDPACVFGAALPWPEPPTGHRPGRKAGAVVLIVDGELVAYLERGAKSLLVWDAPVSAAPAFQALADAVRAGRLGTVSIATLNGEPILGHEHPAAQHLSDAGFVTVPQGLRLRPSVGGGYA